MRDEKKERFARKGNSGILYLGIIVLVLSMVVVGWTTNERYYGSSFKSDVKDLRVSTLSRLLLENFVSFYRSSLYFSLSRAVDEAARFGGVVPPEDLQPKLPISWVCEGATIPSVDETEESIERATLDMAKEMVSGYSVPGGFARDQVTLPTKVKLSRKVRPELHGDQYREYFTVSTDEIEYYVDLSTGEVSAIFGVKTDGNTTVEQLRFWLLRNLIAEWILNNLDQLHMDACTCNAQCSGACACMEQRISQQAKSLESFIQGKTNDPWILCRARMVDCNGEAIRCEEPADSVCSTWQNPPVQNVYCGSYGTGTSIQNSAVQIEMKTENAGGSTGSGDDESGSPGSLDEDGDGFPDFAPPRDGYCRKDHSPQDCTRICYHYGWRAYFHYQMECIDTGYFVESEGGPKPLGFNFRVLLSKQQEDPCYDPSECVDDCPAPQNPGTPTTQSTPQPPISSPPSTPSNPYGG